LKTAHIFERFFSDVAHVIDYEENTSEEFWSSEGDLRKFETPYELRLSFGRQANPSCQFATIGIMNLGHEVAIRTLHSNLESK